MCTVKQKYFGIWHYWWSRKKRLKMQKRSERRRLVEFFFPIANFIDLPTFPDFFETQVKCTYLSQSKFVPLPRGQAAMCWSQYQKTKRNSVLYAKWGLVVRGHLSPIYMFFITTKINFMYFKQHPWLFTFWGQYCVLHSNVVTDWVRVYLNISPFVEWLKILSKHHWQCGIELSSQFRDRYS